MLARLMGLLMVAVLPVAAHGQAPTPDWPQRTIRLVVPYAAGGNVDVGARIVAGRLQEILKQPVVIDNRPGAGGLIALDYVAKATPDGHTYLVGANGPVLFVPVISGRANYDWTKELEAVGPLSFTPLVLEVRANLPVANFKEFLALAKEKDLNMGSGGAGSTNHLSSELLQSRAGVRWTTVHYRGNAPVVTALLANEVDFALEQISVSLPLIRDGKVRALAVTSQQRFPALPDVPTLEELGFPGFEAVTWTGLFAPLGTPKAAIQGMNEALATVLAEPSIAKRFAEMGSDVRRMSSDAFAGYVTREQAKWTPVIRQANIKAE